MMPRWPGVVIGVLLAGIGGALLARHQFTAPVRDKPARAAALTKAVTAQSSALDPRIEPLLAINASLNSRLERLESARTAQPAGDSETSDPEAAQREMVQAERAQYDELIANHERARVNPDWARATTETLKTDLSGIVTTLPGVTFEGIDCRSDSCIARLQFSSYIQAQSEAARLVGESYGVNCATRIQLDEATNPQSPYRLELVFHGCQPQDA